MCEKTDFTKPVQTKSGLRVRILCTDWQDDHYSIIGLISGDDKEDITHERIGTWTHDGFYMHKGIRGNDEGGMDLINIPDEHWVNIYFGTDEKGRPDYKTGCGYFHSKLHAEELAAKKPTSNYNYHTTVRVK